MGAAARLTDNSTLRRNGWAVAVLVFQLSVGARPAAERWTVMEQGMRLVSIAIIPLVIGGCISPDARPSYQYGQLYHSWDRGWESQNVARWETADAQTEGPRLPDLYRRLGGHKPDDKVKLLDVFDLLGQGGWELVYVSRDVRGAESGNVAYYFRRPAARGTATRPPGVD